MFARDSQSNKPKHKLLRFARILVLFAYVDSCELYSYVRWLTSQGTKQCMVFQVQQQTGRHPNIYLNIYCKEVKPNPCFHLFTFEVINFRATDVPSLFVCFCYMLEIVEFSRLGGTQNQTSGFI
jgi:hypothetical protein